MHFPVTGGGDAVHLFRAVDCDEEDLGRGEGDERCGVRGGRGGECAGGRGGVGWDWHCGGGCGGGGARALGGGC